MPVHKVRKGGKVGYKWGRHGKVYRSKSGAEKQARAAFANGYRGDERQDSASPDKPEQSSTTQ